MREINRKPNGQQGLDFRTPFPGRMKGPVKIFARSPLEHNATLPSPIAQGGGGFVDKQTPASKPATRPSKGTGSTSNPSQKGGGLTDYSVSLPTTISTDIPQKFIKKK